jgi:hypothetical protein
VFTLKNLLWYMVVFFAFLTAINLPALWFYGTGDFYNTYGKSFTRQLSLGNTGYNTAQCQTAPMAARELVFKCPVGVTANREFYDGSFFILGVNDLGSDFTTKDNCIYNLSA